MTEVMNRKCSEELAKLKQEIIDDTIHNLLEENDGTFDLSTEQGINVAVNYMVDYLILNKVDPNALDLKENLIRRLPQSKV